MKKQLKLMAVLSAAAVMAVAAPEMNFADGTGTVYAQTKGWVEEDGELRFYDSDGYYLSDSWKKRGDDWYYLDSDGYVTKSEFIDEYYVNEEGKRVANTWISIDNEEHWEDREDSDTLWYYFGRDGKAITSKWQVIEGKYYYFDEDGFMMTGKADIDGETYYLGDDGARKTGWIQLENTDDEADIEYVWHFFENDGKMLKNHVDKKIGGNYYTFVDGVMKTEWVKVEEPSTATPSEAAGTSSSVAGYQYYEEDGKRASGWYQIEGAPGVSEEGEVYSFYFKNGKPYHAEKGIEVFTIDSKKYGFNEKGEMQTDLKVVNLPNGDIANYYFGNDGVVRTGKQTIYDEKLGENQVWFFYTDGSRKGQGFHGIRDNNIYEYGLRKDADRDLRYAPVTFGGSQYLVNTSGAIQKATSSSKSDVKPELGKGFKDVKDDNDKVWVVDVNGIIQQ